MEKYGKLIYSRTVIGQHPRSHMDTRYANLICIILYKFTAYHKHFIFLSTINYDSCIVRLWNTTFSKSAMTIDQVLHCNITMSIENHCITERCIANEFCTLTSLHVVVRFMKQLSTNQSVRHNSMESIERTRLSKRFDTSVLSSFSLG